MNSDLRLKKKLIGIIMLKGIWFHFITFHILSKITFYLIDNENFKRKKFSFKIFQNNKKSTYIVQGSSTLWKQKGQDFRNLVKP